MGDEEEKELDDLLRGLGLPDMEDDGSMGPIIDEDWDDE